MSFSFSIYILLNRIILVKIINIGTIIFILSNNNMAIEYINDDNNTINNILNIKIVDNVSIIYNNRYRNINCYCKRGGEFRFPQLGSRFNAIFVSVLSKNKGGNKR